MEGRWFPIFRTARIDFRSLVRDSGRRTLIAGEVEAWPARMREAEEALPQTGAILPSADTGTLQPITY